MYQGFFFPFKVGTPPYSYTEEQEEEEKETMAERLLY